MSKKEIVIKTPEQIEGIRKACKITAQTLEYIRPYIVPGVSTGEINRLVENFTAVHGGIAAPLGYGACDKRPPFPKSCCTSINDVICHGIPSDDVILKTGDIVNVDVSTIIDGYFGDTSTMFAVGPLPRHAAEIMEVAKNCLEIGIKEVRPGNYIGNIGFAITKYALRRGASVVYNFAGHGTGLMFHEPPEVNHYMTKMNQGAVMLPGMIFTIEPMINAGSPHCRIEADEWTARTIDGKLSAQYEHTVLVTEKGVEILTLP
jgi:methionyl aminopeptidase